MANSLTLVVPVYRTDKLLEKLVGELLPFRALVESLGWQYRGTIIVDDGSPNPDAIAQAAALASSATQLQLVKLDRNRGKGYAVKTGALLARSSHVLMTDCDLSAPLAEFAKLAAAVQAHPELALICGSRHHLQGNCGRSRLRNLLSPIFAGLTRLAGAGSIKDPQCGFKLFRLDLMRPIFETQQIERFAFDVELIRRATRLGLPLAEVPINWQSGRSSTLVVYRDGLRMLYDLLRIALSR